LRKRPPPVEEKERRAQCFRSLAPRGPMAEKFP
jgi:hypothetical protein